jgi:hypothetical protein
MPRLYSSVPLTMPVCKQRVFVFKRYSGLYLLADVYGFRAIVAVDVTYVLLVYCISSSRLVFVREMKCICCAVETELVSIIGLGLRFIAETLRPGTSQQIRGMFRKRPNFLSIAPTSTENALRQLSAPSVRF